MAYLYEKIDALREAGFSEEVPALIKDNINKKFELRPYQNMAFENFIMYFGNEKLCQKPTQVLFHMATGSGKTLIMAGLILYLYKQGYRNFLFFVNLGNIVQKTKENFLNTISSKYLFNEEITIDLQKIRVREVDNFQDADEDSINICFTTTQKLHIDMQFTKEGGMSFDDFSNQKVVLISDEAHHLNADTKKMSADEQESYNSWESTVRRIFEANRDNVLLEFTATCDLENAAIKAAYENKIICDYPLRRFREDGYSKEIKTLRSDLDVNDRALQAIILSQYRYKVFQDNHLNIKPVVFFQSRLVKENDANMASIIEMVQTITGEDIERIFENTTSETVKEAQSYFKKRGITPDILAFELRDDFSENRCISANDNSEIEKKQIALNSLEDKDNPYRAVFAVDKLNEGWDVLNLFDIVRLYETRDGKMGKPGKTTMKEAQLIGRGARYCPFSVEEEQDSKYDIFKFNILRQLFPNLKSTHDFIYYDAYLGNIKLDIVSGYEVPSPALLLKACIKVLGKIADYISGIEKTYSGTKIFKPVKVNEVFKNKKCNFTAPHDGGIGISQNDMTVPPAWKIDLSTEDWFAFEDNFGTSEEKAFVAYFKGYVNKLKREYDKIYLIRNERQFHVYSFDDGERFEPDYVLFLHKEKTDGFEQLQVFVEPKGTHLLEGDAWKERFLLRMKDEAIPVKVFRDDNEYFIWGFHFFNQDKRMTEFNADIDSLFGITSFKNPFETEDYPMVADPVNHETS